MAFHLFPWIVIAFAAGFAARHYIDEIKVWASRILGYILDGISKGIEVTTDAIVYLVKEGARGIFKMVLLYVQDLRTGQIRTEYKQELIDPSKIPDEFKTQLNQRANMELMRLPATKF